MEERIPQNAIDAIAKHINQRNNTQYNIPIIGSESNPETPQIFEIMPFSEIDSVNCRWYAIDGSTNSHSFYNGVSIGLYRGGYISFQGGRQVRMNEHDDPVILGKAYTPENILITCREHLFAIYDELLVLPPVRKFLEFLADEPEEIFPYSRDVICSSMSTVLSFCQEILEWSLVYEISGRDEVTEGDYILKDGTLRSLNIKQKYLVKLGEVLSKEMGLIIVGITKNSPVKMELT